MNKTIMISLVCVAGLSAAEAAAEKYAIERSLVVSAPADEVWNLIGDFCDIDDWHPAISSCQLKAIDGGVHRILTLADGGEIIEKRIAEEQGASYTYRIMNSPLPIEKYTATFSISRGEETTVAWSGRFTSEDPAMEATMIGIYEAGLAGIEAALQ